MCDAPPASQIRMQLLTFVGLTPPDPPAAGPEPEQVGQAEAEGARQAGLEQLRPTVGPVQAVGVTPGSVHRGPPFVGAMGRDQKGRSGQWLKANSREFSRAQKRSSAASLNEDAPLAARPTSARAPRPSGPAEGP